MSSSVFLSNLTVTGSVANIIVVETARPQTKIGFWDYFRVGLPITVMTLLVGWAWLAWVKF
jgi:Na+/H+ antiporter NhaD/arsenite permease-like protein